MMNAQLYMYSLASSERKAASCHNRWKIFFFLLEFHAPVPTWTVDAGSLAVTEVFVFEVSLSRTRRR